MSRVISNTPWEPYQLDGVEVWVKREDKCTPFPGPQFSKIRGVERHLDNLIAEQGKVPIGVLDTLHSKAGWGVAWLCKDKGLPCYDFFPVYKHEWVMDGFIPRENQISADRFGATLVPMEAGRSAILYHRAKKALAHMTNGQGHMMPNALKLPESIDATAEELRSYTPEGLCEGTWVISASSGTIAAGVLRGLTEVYSSYNPTPLCLIIHLGYSRPRNAVLDYVYKAAGWAGKADICIVDEGYEYKDRVEFDCPFPCNPYYDLKAWKWLSTHAHNLQEPVVFWNVGA